MKKFDVELDEAIRNAKLWAKSIYGSDTVYTSHLFLGIVGDNYNILWNIIFASGVDIHLMMEKVKMIASEYKKEKIITDVFYSKEVENILLHASKNCKTDEISSFDIIVSMFKIKNDIQHIFNDFKFDLVQLKETYAYEKIEHIFEEDYYYEEEGSFDPVEHGGSKKTNIDFNFCTNLTELAKKGTFNKLIGREHEMKMIMTSLLKPKKNNIILIGEAGVGKTNIVEELAAISGYEIHSLDVNKMMSNTKYRGELEAKLDSLVNEFKNQPNKILFIDEAHMLRDVGGGDGGVSFFNTFKPAMGRGEIKLILATTNEEYSKFIENDKAIIRRCSIIQIKEPDKETTKFILNNYCKKNNIICDDTIITEIYDYSADFMPNKYFPDKALEILDNMIAVKKYNIIHNKNVDPELQDIEIEKQRIVDSKDYSKAKALLKREKLINSKKRKKDDSKILLEYNDLKDTVLTFYGHTYKDTKNLLNYEDYYVSLTDSVKGHDEIIEDVLKKYFIHYMKSPEKPLVLYFLGESGIGKSELAKKIGELLFQGKFLKLDMTEFQESHSVDQLIGSPPGYVGYEKPGQLSYFIQNNPKGLVVLEEFEKGHSAHANLFLGVFESGDLMDRRGVKINCKNTMFIITSNEGINRHKATVGYTHDDSQVDVQSLLKNKFKPEFLNRIEEFYWFQKPNEEVIKKYAIDMFNRLSLKYDEHIDDTISIDAIDIMGSFNKGGFRNLYRDIKKYIEKHVFNIIIKKGV